MTVPTLPAEAWPQLYVAPPPAPGACTRDDGHLFFFTEQDEAAGVMNRKTGRPRDLFARQVSAALALCAACPLATREWCRDSVRASRSGATIIAAGTLYAHGRAVWTLDDERRQERAA